MPEIAFVDSVFAWAKENPQNALSFAVSAATIISVALAYLGIRLTKRLFVVANRPYLEVYLRNDPPSGRDTIKILIMNKGHAPAAITKKKVKILQNLGGGKFEVVANDSMRESAIVFVDGDSDRAKSSEIKLTRELLLVKPLLTYIIKIYYKRDWWRNYRYYGVYEESASPKAEFYTFKWSTNSRFKWYNHKKLKTQAEKRKADRISQSILISEETPNSEDAKNLGKKGGNSPKGKD